MIIFFFGKYLSYLFISDNAAEVIPMVDTYVKCVAVFFIPLHFVNALRNGIQGMGYGLLPMLAGVAELAGRGITAMAAALIRVTLEHVWPVRWHGCLPEDF